MCRLRVLRTCASKKKAIIGYWSMIHGQGQLTGVKVGPHHGREETAGAGIQPNLQAEALGRAGPAYVSINLANFQETAAKSM